MLFFGGFFERILRVGSILREFLTSAFHSKRQVGSLAEDKEVTERKAKGLSVQASWELKPEELQPGYKHFPGSSWQNQRM